MAAEGKDMRLIRQYRQLVEDYEAIDSRIDELIMSKRGKSEDMSIKDRRLYREMARRRSEIQNEMRLLERQLNLMEDDTPGAE